MVSVAKHKLSSKLLIVCLVLVAGCTSIPTKDIRIITQADPKVNFEGYNTYTWLGTAAIIRDPFGQWEPPTFDADSEIKYLIDRELRKRGMLENSSDPDLVAAFAVGVDMERLQLKVDPKTKIGVLENMPGGGLFVVFVDPSTGYVAWAGRATANILEKPDPNTVKMRLDYAVTQMLKEFPKRKVSR